MRIWQREKGIYGRLSPIQMSMVFHSLKSNYERFDRRTALHGVLQKFIQYVIYYTIARSASCCLWTILSTLCFYSSADIQATDFDRRTELLRQRVSLLRLHFCFLLFLRRRNLFFLQCCFHHFRLWGTRFRLFSTICGGPYNMEEG